MCFLSTGGFRGAQLRGQNPHCLQSDDNETVSLTDFCVVVGVVCMMRALGIGGRVWPIIVLSHRCPVIAWSHSSHVGL